MLHGRAYNWAINQTFNEEFAEPNEREQSTDNQRSWEVDEANPIDNRAHDSQPDQPRKTKPFGGIQRDEQLSQRRMGRQRDCKRKSEAEQQVQHVVEEATTLAGRFMAWRCPRPSGASADKRRARSVPIHWAVRAR